MQPPTRMRSKDLHTSALQLLNQCLGGHDEVDLGRARYLHVAGVLVLTPVARDGQASVLHPRICFWACRMS